MASRCTRDGKKSRAMMCERASVYSSSSSTTWRLRDLAACEEGPGVKDIVCRITDGFHRGVLGVGDDEDREFVNMASRNGGSVVEVGGGECGANCPASFCRSKWQVLPTASRSTSPYELLLLTCFYHL